MIPVGSRLQVSETRAPRLRRDPLTRLPNRVGLRGAFQSSSRGAESAALAVLELSSLGEVNARHGCLEGDRLLRYFSDRLAENLPGSTAGRWGGNAFLVIFPGTSSARASITLAEALAPLVSEPYQTLGQTPLQISVAAGLTEVGAVDTSTLDELVSVVPLVSV